MSLFSISFMLSGLCASASEGLSDVLSSGISQEISAGGTESGGILAVQYLFYFLIIILGIVFLTLFRRRVSRGLTCAAVKEKCLTLKKLLEETLDSSGRKKKKIRQESGESGNIALCGGRGDVERFKAGGRKKEPVV